MALIDDMTTHKVSPLGLALVGKTISNKKKVTKTTYTAAYTLAIIAQKLGLSEEDTALAYHSWKNADKNSSKGHVYKSLERKKSFSKFLKLGRAKFERDVAAGRLRSK